MKLSKIYSNSEIFLPVIFNTNNEKEGLLNIIYAEAKAPENKNLDLHNLGKSLFIELLDFNLLKGITKFHFLHKHRSRFTGCKFYIEILLNSGKYMTICRSVDENTKISIKFHDIPNQDYTNLNKEDWDHYNVAFDNAKKIINSHLNLSIISPWDYRQGISYFLRTQNDYNDYFQIAKFSKGEDINWKPYIAHILGFDYKLLTNKYEIEKSIEQCSSEKELLSKNLKFKEEEFDKLNSIVNFETAELSQMNKQLNSFDFSEEEVKVNKKIAKEIEYKISLLNDKLYNINYDITQIQTSLKNKLHFDLSDIKKIYEEAKLYLPENLLTDYESLIDFNKQITKERNANLKKRLEILQIEADEIEQNINKLGQERKKCLAILKGENTFKKYKALQNEYSERKAKLLNDQQQLEYLKKMKVLTTKINKLKKSKISLENKLNKAIVKQSLIYKNIVKDFTEMAKKVFNKLVILSTRINQKGNLEFDISFKDNDSLLGKDTSESDGNTYKKILCVLFDLAILRQYYNQGFYHFVYHDGIFEALEPRKKEKLLEIIRESIDKYNIQYIFTALESDMPLNKDGNPIRFKDNEYILTLNDLGNEGRLFKMNEF